jgi:prephenate dehydrogenase
VRWAKVTIIGVGLLGGSIGLALRRRKLAREVHGYVRRRAAVNESVRLGAVHQAGTDLGEAVRNADLVILCTPIERMEALINAALPELKPGAIVTDVGSVKATVVRRLENRISKAGAHFIGSHPMAGSDKGGVRAARPSLFEDAVCVVTPTRRTLKPALSRLQRFWQSLGAQVLTMDAALHDRLVCSASHLPHMVASLLALHVLDPRLDKRQARLCATGFRDTTRIAASSPEMWRDIALANRQNLARDLAAFEKRLRSLRALLAKRDAEGLERILARAHELRSRWKPTKDGRSPE